MIEKFSFPANYKAHSDHFTVQTFETFYWSRGSDLSYLIRPYVTQISADSVYHDDGLFRPRVVPFNPKYVLQFVPFKLNFLQLEIQRKKGSKSAWPSGQAQSFYMLLGWAVSSERICLVLSARLKSIKFIRKQGTSDLVQGITIVEPLGLVPHRHHCWRSAVFFEIVKLAAIL